MHMASSRAHLIHSSAEETVLSCRIQICRNPASDIEDSSASFKL